MGLLFRGRCGIIVVVIIGIYIDNESWIYWGDLENMRKVILLFIGILSFSFYACTLQTSDSSVTTENKQSTEEKTNMLTIDDIISDIPKNAAYRKTILQSYPSGGESRWDIFYDEHDNEVCNICTSDILNHPDQDFALSDDSPFRSNTFYIYNADGMILKRTIRFMDEIKETKFEYSKDNLLICEVNYTDGIEGATVLYENDDHGNPVVEIHTVNGETVYIDEYEYHYDENGCITYKIWKSRLFEEQIIYYWYEYDEHGNLIMKKEFKEGAAVPSYEKYFYDGNNRLIRQDSYLDDKILAENVYEYDFYD